MGWQQYVAARIRAGEAAGLAQLYARTAGQVFRVAVVLTGSMTVAEEITQAVFLQVWRSPDALVRHSHHNQLEGYLIHLVCRRARIWRALIPPDKVPVPVSPGS